MTKDKNTEEIDIQICDYLTGNCTEEERRRLFQTLAADQEKVGLFHTCSLLWALASSHFFAREEKRNLSRVKERIGRRTPMVRTRRSLPLWIKIAAAVLLLIGCNYFWYHYTEQLTELYTCSSSPYEIKVPAGSTTSLVLPDGTKVTLNSGSTLRYDRSFGIHERHVSLDGEGYFQVFKNTEMPFYVSTDGIDVKVTGTIFNVQAYENDNYVMVSLLEGRVELHTASQTVMPLYPDEQALYDRQTGRIEKTKMNVHKSCEWLNGGLSFENSTFADIAHRLERKYQVKILIESERLKSECFSGSFDKNQTINDILREINVDKQYTWSIQSDTILITDKRKEEKQK